MRHVAGPHPGEAKTDARDAAIIAMAARTMPYALRSLQLADEQVAELTILCGFDDDPAAQITATSNRIRGLLTQTHPALERGIGPHLDHPVVLDLLQDYRSPAALAAAGETCIGNRLVKLALRLDRRLATEIVGALGEQTVGKPFQTTVKRIGALQYGHPPQVPSKPQSRHALAVKARAGDRHDRANLL